MTGRVYDPTIGRFLSADPFVQDATNTQALNAYSYVLNNPLSYTDPSGFFFSKIFRAIGRAFSAIGRAFAHAAKAVIKSSIGRAILQIIGCAAAGPVGCSFVSAALTLAAGGTIKQALIGAAIGFAQIGAYGAIHSAISGLSGAALFAAKLTLHAVVGGAVSMAQGGDFLTGALTGAIAAGSSLLMDSSGMMGQSGDGDPGNVAARTAVSAVAGGTASVLSGGKFANGAITGAFAQMYNAEGLGTARAARAGSGVALRLSATAATAGTLALMDGPLPIGDLLGGGLLVYDVLDELYDSFVYKGGESEAAADGRAAHGNYGTALGEDYDTGVRLPSGKKPDAVNWGAGEVRELKPDNSAAIARGRRQVEGYRQELEKMTGRPWTSAVDTYRPGGQR